MIAKKSKQTKIVIKKLEFSRLTLLNYVHSKQTFINFTTNLILETKLLLVQLNSTRQILDEIFIFKGCKGTLASRRNIREIGVRLLWEGERAGHVEWQ